jgi:O-acetyl-ADP-ribose deacetylase (regulator of RNase III)
MQIHVVRSDLTEMPVDAVVNPANSLGVMSGGVAAALREAGGQQIEDEARASAPIAVGAAVVTTGGDLFAKHVIHAPTMEEPGLKIGVENVRRATRAALIAAGRLQLDTIALPGMGTGVGGVPVEEAARAMVDELRAHKQEWPKTIYLVATTDHLLAAFENELKNALQST